MQSGHKAGNLNFTVTRKGWTRNITFTPDEVSTMDYATIESVLELKTIKAVRSNLRIFVENPAGSGSFMQLRPWKAQDGSIQAALLQNFFEERLRAGTVTNLDVRDGADDVKQSVKTGDWLRAQVSNITGSHTNGNSDEGQIAEGARESQETQPPTKETQAGFFTLFKSSHVPPENPSEAESAENEAKAKEEEILRERGWQPMFRRLTSKRFKSKRAGQEPDIQAEGDGEEIQTPDGEEPNTLPERTKSRRKHPFSNFKVKVKEDGAKTPPPVPVKEISDSN
ncbi:hypothetical protein L218DRAFT_230906 [Marasmius fiardii PR-910]|nr:hypothetical protein L218DRAFT_230906 [Marasmius fiardii PR-910]